MKKFIVFIIVSATIGLILYFSGNEMGQAMGEGIFEGLLEGGGEVFITLALGGIVGLITTAVSKRRGESANSRADQNTWTCLGCGEKNTMYAEKCSTCGKQRPEYISAQLNQQDDNGNASIAPDLLRTWECPDCGEENEMSAARCISCGNDRPSDVKTQFKTWKCPRCGDKYMMSATRCITCGTDRPREITIQLNREKATRGQNVSVDNENSSITDEAPSGSWNCPICGMRNKTGDFRCRHCDNEKPNIIPLKTPPQPQNNSGKIDLSKRVPDASGVEDIVYCRKCGTKLPGDSLFCSKCGTKIL